MRTNPKVPLAALSQPLRATVLVLVPILGLLATPSNARAGDSNMLVNGSFESGAIDPWDPEMSFDPEGAEIVSPGRTDNFALHLDAGEYDDFYHVIQEFSPIAADSVASVSLWSLCPTPVWGHAPFVILGYTDGTTTQADFPLTEEWTQFDATSLLVSGKMLDHFEIFWEGLGDEGPSSELFVDDVAINVVPAPAASGIAVPVALAVFRRRSRQATL